MSHDEVQYLICTGLAGCLARAWWSQKLSVISVGILVFEVGLACLHRLQRVWILSQNWREHVGLGGRQHCVEAWFNQGLKLYASKQIATLFWACLLINTMGTMLVQYYLLIVDRGFSGGSVVKKLPANAEDARETHSVPGSGRSPEKEMATHSSILAWETLWIEEPGGLQSIGLHRVEHNWACTLLSIKVTVKMKRANACKVLNTVSGTL